MKMLTIILYANYHRKDHMAVGTLDQFDAAICYWPTCFLKEPMKCHSFK